MALRVSDGAAWLSEARHVLDFNLRRLAYRVRAGQLEGVCLEGGTLIVTPTASDVPATAEELNVEISEMYPLVEVPDLLETSTIGRALLISSHMSARATPHEMYPPCWPAS